MWRHLNDASYGIFSTVFRSVFSAVEHILVSSLTMLLVSYLWVCLFSELRSFSTKKGAKI